jgi:hypothetical protein
MKKSQRGFTLLLAALVSSIVLSLGASIFVVAKKELALSSIGRDSQYAYYTADQAAECALYWDQRPEKPDGSSNSFFATSTPNNPSYTPICDGQSLIPAGLSDMPGRPPSGPPVTYPYTMSFTYSPTTGGTSYCANVRVEKCDGPIAANGTCTSVVPAVIHTLIHADGYNTTCATLTTNTRALQRSVELHF